MCHMLEDCHFLAPWQTQIIHMLLLLLINVTKHMLLLLIDVMFPNLACQTDANKNDTSGLV